MYLSAFITCIAMIASIILIFHPVLYVKLFGITVFIGVCISAFEPKIVSFLIKFIKGKSK